MKVVPKKKYTLTTRDVEDKFEIGRTAIINYREMGLEHLITSTGRVRFNEDDVREFIEEIKSNYHIVNQKKEN